MSFRIYFFVFLTACLLFVESLQAQTVSIGSVWKDETINYYESDHPMAWIVRQAAMPGLTKRKQRAKQLPPYTLELSDSMQVDSNLQKWKFRLRRDAFFSNGEVISAEDLIFSIDLCKSYQILPSTLVATSLSESLGNGGQWISLETNSASQNSDLGLELPIQLSKCPVLHKEITTLFERDFAINTNLVAAGKFAITEFDLRRKQLALQRIYTHVGQQVTLKQLYLRGFSNDSEGLAALRVGTIDAFVAATKETLERVTEDETLDRTICDKYQFIFRKGLNLNCDPDLDIEHLHYVQ